MDYSIGTQQEGEGMTLANVAAQQESTSLTKEGLDRTRDQLALLENFVSDVLAALESPDFHAVALANLPKGILYVF